MVMEILTFLKNQILPYFHCFDRQEAKIWPLEAHDGGMFQDFCTDEHAQILAVLEESLRNSKSWFIPLPTSIKHSILAR